MWKLWKLNADLVGSPEGGTDWEVWGNGGPLKLRLLGGPRFRRWRLAHHHFFEVKSFPYFHERSMNLKEMLKLLMPVTGV